MDKIKILCKFIQKLPETEQLRHRNDFELFVAIVLAAQTNDKVTNKVLESLPYKTFEELANANLEDVANAIKKVGYHKQKAKLLINGSKYIVRHYKGTLPCKLELLLKVPGIGRKSASYILWKKCDLPYLVVDTHMKRIIKRFCNIELTEKNVWRYESAWKSYIKCLNAKIPSFGRLICTAKNPKCHKCVINNVCDSFQNR